MADGIVEPRHLDAVGIGVVVCAADGTIRTANDAAARMAGVGTATLAGRHVQSLVPASSRFSSAVGEELAADNLEIWSALASGQALGEVTARIEGQDGEAQWVVFSGAPIVSPEGVVESIVITFTQVSERHRAEELVRESDRQYRELFDHSLAAIAVHEIVTDDAGEPIDYIYLATNDAFTRLTGLVDVVGKRVTEALPGLEPRYVERFGRVALEGRPDQWEDYVEALDRSYDIVAFCPRPRRFVAIFTETTQRRRTEKVMRTLARATAGAGEGFFSSLVLELAGSLKVRFAMISEVTPEGGRAQTIGACRDGEVVDDFVYDLACSPCEVVVNESVCFVPRGAREAFSDDQMLVDMEIESYHGVLVRDTVGRPLGILAIMHGKPMPEDESEGVRDLLMVCAARAGAELERLRTGEEMRHLLLHDRLTGLPNRTLFEDRLRQTLARAGRRRRRFAVAALDIDRLKKVTDSLGHAAAEQLVAAVAERLEGALNDGDTVARSGGNEFMLLLPEARVSAVMAATVERLRATFEYHFPVDGHDVYLTPSIGVAVFPEDGADADRLMHNAAAAMRRVKDQGGNAWQFFYRSMNAEAGSRIDLERDLHRALELGRFVLHYQPQVDTGSGAIVGVEALLRWQDPDRGLVEPLDFLDLAEESGLIVPIGAWVLRTACEQARQWNGYDSRVRMGVNLSPRQFLAPDLVDCVSDALTDSGLAGSLLELEITETTALLDPERTDAVVGALKELGVRIALDDFGTGYSSLSHLARLPIDTLKIDRSFVSNLDSVPEHVIIVTSVISLGHRLGLTVVAEGVETPGQAAFLHKERCDVLQGFLLSQPVPGPECEALIAAGPLTVATEAIATIDLGRQAHSEERRHL